MNKLHSIISACGLCDIDRVLIRVAKLCIQKLEKFDYKSNREPQVIGAKCQNHGISPIYKVRFLLKMFVFLFPFLLFYLKTSFSKFFYDELEDFYSTAFKIQLADKILRIDHIHSRTIHFVPDIWIFVQIFHLRPKPSLTLFLCCPGEFPVEIRADGHPDEHFVETRRGQRRR